MENDLDKLLIGLTGSFASGCGEVADYLSNDSFYQLSLSSKIKEVVREKGLISNRENLQNIGDDLREANGRDYLAKVISEELDKLDYKKFVIKSFRNHHEVAFFNKRYRSFFLLNIDAERENRYERVMKDYTRQEVFDRDDERDSGEGQPKYGQHVRLCVDMSDVVINNNKDKKDLYNKIDRYIELIKEPGKYPPFDHEISMAQACRESTRTGCIKRAVGAVITQNKRLITSGYNSTPSDINPCINLEACYRDDIRKCPDCGMKIQMVFNQCINCKSEIGKQQISEIGKNLDLCRAIHAEERAIIQIARLGGNSLIDSTLYTTTFPCVLCAKKIIEVGIKEVWFIEPYPYREAKNLLLSGNVILKKFEGVKSKAFDDLYQKKII